MPAFELFPGCTVIALASPDDIPAAHNAIDALLSGDTETPRLEIGETGPDWEPDESTRYYAQWRKADGKTVETFGPTQIDALAGLMRRLIDVEPVGFEAARMEYACAIAREVAAEPLPVALADIETYQELDRVPAYEAPIWNDKGGVDNRDVLKWGDKNPPPAIGAEIVVTINSIGPGRVVGYFVQDGFLGLRVQHDCPPPWYLKQNGGNVPGHVFGTEFRSGQTHAFSDTGDAYDATQCRDDIRDGDVLLCECEHVVGLADTWPIAVTAESGNLHSVKPGADALAVLKDAGISPMQARLAVAVAMASGFRIDPAFEQFRHAPSHASAIVQRMMREARDVGESHHISVMGVTCQWQRDGAFVWGRYGVVGNATREDAAAAILENLEA